LTKAKTHITVFEHEILRTDRGEKRLSEDQLRALQNYSGDGLPYYDLCHHGVRFKEYVGVIQIGKTQIEVLPKADKNDKDETKWRNLLIDMLRAVGGFEIKATSQSHLKIKPNTILELYFELYIQQLEYLLHQGLIKQYRKKEGNVTALKGSLQFGKHIQQNLTHQERFYARHTTYDVEHQLHFILYKALCLLQQINTQTALMSRIGALMLHFPPMPDIKVTAATFEKIVFNRKNQSYKKAIEIAEFLLLQYHPDISKGRNDMLALMFDMNKLWEQFVYVSLRKHMGTEKSVRAQTMKHFWKPETGQHARLEPDIVINHGRQDCIVLDTKWKNLNGSNPSPDDLRQMYAYSAYFGAQRVALIYPGNVNHVRKGVFLPSANEHSLVTPTTLSDSSDKVGEMERQGGLNLPKAQKTCSLVLIKIPETNEQVKMVSIKTWQKAIGDSIAHLFH
jgi:5-methylcytosine-specific restriction enzyme subunit McrC